MNQNHLLSVSVSSFSSCVDEDGEGAVCLIALTVDDGPGIDSIIVAGRPRMGFRQSTPKIQS